MRFDNVLAVLNLPIDFTWSSPLRRIGFLRTMLFALAGGECNPVHLNPFMSWFYRSNLGGMTAPGDMVLALTKRGIHQAFRFNEDTEVIAFGYEEVHFKRPLHVRTQYTCTYCLLERKMHGGRVTCRWKVTVADDSGKVAMTAIWVNGFWPVAQRQVAVDMTVVLVTVMAGIVISFPALYLMRAYWYAHMENIAYAFGGM